MITDSNIKDIAILQIDKIKDSLEVKWPSIQNPSYETGLLGLSLFYCYYSLFTNDETYTRKAEYFFVKGISTLDISDFRPIYKTDSLDSQLAHIGRFIEFCKINKFLQLDADDYLMKIDNVLSCLMKTKISFRNFDSTSGALASGYYYLSRTTRNDIILKSLIELVEGIEEMAFQDSDGDYYWKVSSLGQRVYLGISHGSALLISFLANLYEKGIERDKCSNILKKAVKFLLKQQANYAIGLFPNYIGDKDGIYKQFSLCYGDLGIGYALTRASIVLKNTELSNIAFNILNDCFDRKKEDNLTLDASIIYGASGLAATFEKIFFIRNDNRFLEAANYWYSQIPTYAVHQNEFAGFKSRFINAGDL